MIYAVLKTTARRYAPKALTIVSLVASMLMYGVAPAAATAKTGETAKISSDDHIYRKDHDRDNVRAREHRHEGKWLSGDFHQHTYYTDGSTPFDFVMSKNNEYGLDWWANSEHGGSRNRDGNGHLWTDPLYYPVNLILGDVSGSPQVMWRWQSLRDFVYADVVRNRGLYPAKQIFSGYEWNVPGHEHCSTAIVGKDGSAISAFEFMFDASDNDTSRIGEVTPYGVLEKKNGRTYTITYDADGRKIVTSAGKPTAARHLDAVAGCGWMQAQYDQKTIDNAWIIFAHIERAQSYRVEHFRDLHNAGPDVCYGFEGAPGHQVNPLRGFGNLAFGGTYGGVGFFTAKVGGLWDALLGEGRRWFNFANSDYHAYYARGGDDFYPGEYQKTWVYAVDKDGNGEYSLDEIADGLRSGRSFFAMGDLVDHLEFTAWQDRSKASMGGTLDAERDARNPVKLKIKFKSPAGNHCRVDGSWITSCAAPTVDHIDLIMGEISGKIDPSDPRYTEATNDTARVIASFTAEDWKTDEDGYNVITHTLKDIEKDVYFRLRGTNLPPNTPYETDEAGNPLPDNLVTQYLGIDEAQEAWNDLWFYSNPVFIDVEMRHESK